MKTTTSLSSPVPVCSEIVSAVVRKLASFSDQSFIGHLLRLPLRLIPPGTKVRIRQGKLRGTKWLTGSSEATLWLGAYEPFKQELFERSIKKGDVVYDLGANVGFYSLLASQLVGDSGKVVAFEPSSRNLDYLNRHLKINQVTNCRVIDAAVSNYEGFCFFEPTIYSTTGHISTDNARDACRVRAVQLDRLTASGALPDPNVIKCDIEGGEYDALLGARDTLLRCKPILFLATHSGESHQNCCELLHDLGYTIESLDTKIPFMQADEVIARFRANF